MSQALAPAYSHRRILNLSLITECPHDLSFGGLVMRGHSADIAKDPSVCARASSEDVAMMKRKGPPR